MDRQSHDPRFDDLRHLIVSKFNSIDTRFDRVENRQHDLAVDVASIKSDTSHLKEESAASKKQIDELSVIGHEVGHIKEDLKETKQEMLGKIEDLSEEVASKNKQQDEKIEEVDDKTDKANTEVAVAKKTAGVISVFFSVVVAPIVFMILKYYFKIL